MRLRKRMASVDDQWLKEYLSEYADKYGVNIDEVVRIYKENDQDLFATTDMLAVMKDESSMAAKLRKQISDLTEKESVEATQGAHSGREVLKNLKEIGYQVISDVQTGVCPDDGDPEGYILVERNGNQSKLYYDCTGIYISD